MTGRAAPGKPHLAFDGWTGARTAEDSELFSAFSEGGQEASDEAVLPDGFGGNDGNPFFVFSLVVTILDPPGPEVVLVNKDIRWGHVVCAFKSESLPQVAFHTRGFSFLQMVWKAGYSNVGFNVCVLLNRWLLS